VDEFERELDWMLKKFCPVSLEEVAAAVQLGSPLPEKSFFLSFDDGFREMAEIVAPICRRKGVPATFFLNPDFLDNRKLCYRHKASVLLDAFSRMEPARVRVIVEEVARRNNLRFSQDVRKFVLGIRYPEAKTLDDAAQLAGVDFAEFLRVERPYLTSQQVRALIADGFSIGAHSMDHPRYSDISLEQQLSQTRDSIGFLQKNYGMKRRAFAFPFTSDNVSEEFYQQIFAEKTCDIIFSIGALPRHPGWPVVERFGVERDNKEPVWTILRDRNRHRLRLQLSRWIAPLRAMVK
jgi:peptidoglycan/xylan/chitin deacetylase (PgdA/CDA1 family)